MRIACTLTLSILFSLFTYGEDGQSLSWKCEQDHRSTGGAFESVQLVPNGLLHQLLFTYIPADPGLPTIENLELVSNLHCRFYLGTPELVQCVSTNFKRYIETVEGDSWTVNIQSDLLLWPKAYQNQKTDGAEQFTVDPTQGFCGFVSSAPEGK